MEFQCSKCGACCRRAGKTGLVPQREDGACFFLNEDNTCRIYKDRPDVCDVRKMAAKFNIPLIDYYKIANEICNVWIKEDGMDDSYLIDIGKYGPDTAQS